MCGDFLGFEHLYDARIHTEDGFDFLVHRVLLATKSEYFNNLLCVQDEKDVCFLVPSIKGRTMKVIVDYLYTGRLSSGDYDISDVLIGSYFLGIQRLLQNCRTLASRNLSTDNCIPLFLAAMKIENLGIVGPCTRFIVINFEDIIRNPNSRFEDLPFQSLEQFLALDNLNVSDEDQIFRAIISWVSKDTARRKYFLKYLIQHIRFCEANRDLFSEVYNHPLILDNPCCQQIKKCYNVQNFRLRVPKEFYFFTKLFISRSDYAEGIKLYITYDEDIDVWRNVGSKIFCPDVVLYGSGSLIMMFDTSLNIVYSFDTISKIWSLLQPPTIPRREYNVIKHGKFIYVMGGMLPDVGEQQIITAMERYSFDSRQWEFRRPHYSLSQGGVAVVDDRIYMIGTFFGFYNEVILAQSYNPNTDSWTSLNPPNIYRRQFAFVAYKKDLYVIGGHNNDGFLKSVEVYDIEKNSWSEMENLPFAYFLPRAVVIKDTLYVYDNHSEDFYDYRCPPVLWDEINNTWIVVKASSPYNDLHIYHFCLIDDSDVINRMRVENRHPGTKWQKSPFFEYL